MQLLLRLLLLLKLWRLLLLELDLLLFQLFFCCRQCCVI